MSTLHRHFSSRERLYDAVAVWGWTRLADGVEAQLPRAGTMAAVGDALAGIGAGAVRAIPWLEATGQVYGRSPKVLLPDRARAQACFALLLERAQATGAARPSIDAADLFDLALVVRSPERWRRQLALAVDGVQAF